MVFFLHSFLFAVMWFKRHSIFLKSSGFLWFLGKIEPYSLYSTLFSATLFFPKQACYVFHLVVFHNFIHTLVGAPAI